MKKLNTIDYGGKIIGIGLLFLAAIPAVLYALNRFFNARAIQILLFVSLGIGVMIEAGFGCVLLLEWHQDRVINDYYATHPESAKTPQQILDQRLWKSR